MGEAGHRPIRDTLRAILGPRHTWGLGPGAKRLSADLPARMRDALARASEAARHHEAQPVFVLSAGWRSGSTLLQRMIMEHNADVLLWGEPYSHANIHDGLLNQFRAFTDRWPLESFFVSSLSLKNPSDTWVANLYPDVDQLLKAHRSFYEALFAEPAREAGRANWGLKEVRLGIDHATYLRALFPKCRIILLYRNPRRAYQSFREWNSAVARRWPDFIATPYAFGRSWAELTRGYLEGHQRVQGLLIRYEDLDDRDQVDRLQAYLGWPVPRSSEMRRILEPGTDPQTRRMPRRRLPAADRVLLDLATRHVLRDAGYGN